MLCERVRLMKKLHTHTHTMSHNYLRSSRLGRFMKANNLMRFEEGLEVCKETPERTVSWRRLQLQDCLLSCSST